MQPYALKLELRMLSALGWKQHKLNIVKILLRRKNLFYDFLFGNVVWEEHLDIVNHRWSIQGYVLDHIEH